MSFYHFLTETSQYIIPQIYKQRFFKKQVRLSRENIFERKVEPELLWLTEFLPKDAVFMDVGANVGHFLFQLEYHLFPQNIYAFEPNKSLNKKLKRLTEEFIKSQNAIFVKDYENYINNIIFIPQS